MQPLEVSEERERLVSLILSENLGKIMVLGGPDRGKSTLCEFLVTRLTLAGFPAVLVDSDLGQKQVGPPAVITAVRVQAQGTVPSFSLAGMYFVGAVTPLRNFLPVIIGTRKIVEKVQPAKVVINTSGLVAGPGIALKAFKVEEICPDLLIAIQQRDELEPLLAGLRNRGRIVRIRPSPFVTKKSPEKRRKSREAGYRSYFAGAGTLTLKLDDCVVQRGSIPLERPRNLTYGGLLCGLCSMDETLLGLGILEKVNPREGIGTFVTPVGEAVSVIQVGSVWISRSGEELRAF